MNLSLEELNGSPDKSVPYLSAPQLFLAQERENCDRIFTSTGGFGGNIHIRVVGMQMCPATDEVPLEHVIPSA